MTSPSDREILAALLSRAGLPSAVSVTRQTGRGFDNQISTVVLADRRCVVLRRFRRPRTPEWVRAHFLARHGIPAPALLAANEHGSLLEFVDGELLGDLIETRRDTTAVWRMVGDAYRRVHAVGFPSGLAGEDLAPDRFVLTVVDPAQELHAQVERAEPGLRRLLPECTRHLRALQDVVEELPHCARRRTPSAMATSTCGTF